MLELRASEPPQTGATDADGVARLHRALLLRRIDDAARSAIAGARSARSSGGGPARRPAARARTADAAGRRFRTAGAGLAPRRTDAARRGRAPGAGVSAVPRHLRGTADEAERTERDARN